MFTVSGRHTYPRVVGRALLYARKAILFCSNTYKAKVHARQLLALVSGCLLLGVAGGAHSNDLMGTTFSKNVTFELVNIATMQLGHLKWTRSEYRVLRTGPFKPNQNPAADLNPGENESLARKADWVLVNHAGPLVAIAGSLLCALTALLVHQRMRLKQSNLQLQVAEARFNELAQSQPSLMCRCDTEGNVCFANAAFCQQFGVSTEHLLGQSLQELFEPAQQALIAENLSRVVDELVPFQFELEDNSGVQTLWRSWELEPILSAEDELVGIHVVGNDVTDRKRAEEADKNLAHALRLAVAGELTAMVAHEVSQPLGAIMANAEAGQMLLARAEINLGEVQEILADICDSVSRANAAVRRMRSLMSRHDFKMQPINLNETVAMALKLVEGDIIKRRIQLVQKLSLDLPKVEGDQVFLQQVLINLIVNAMDAMEATPDDKRVMSIETQQLNNRTITVQVADSGAGIPKDNIQSIFTSFYSTKKEGMGLGLAICRSIIESHHGKIWAENNHEQGAKIQFTLKVA